MGTYGIIPIHLMELVNATHRTFLSGLVYQLGNLISLPSATIAAKIGAQFPIIVPGLTNAYNYGKVMALFTCAVFVYNIIIAFVGPERFHRDLHVHSDHLSISEIRDSDDEEKVGSKHIEKAELK